MNDGPTRLAQLFPLRLAFKNCGFTIVEMLVSMSLTLILLGAIYSVYRVQIHYSKAQEKRLDAIQYARAALDMMVREIRNAGYTPTGAACAGVAAGASAQSLRFLYDANGDGDCGDPDEDVAYAFTSAGCPGGFGDVTRNGTPLTDCNVPTGANSFFLLYYPKQTGAAAPPPYCFSPGVPSGCSGDLGANLKLVQRVTISLTIQSKNTDAEFGSPTQVTVVSHADLRNHGLI